MGAYDGRRGWVYHLAVEPDHQGRGIGRALMAELETRMVAQGVRKLNLQVRADNVEVAAFYEKLGYADEHLTSFGKWLKPPDRG
jgi:ribosomal protein S18 acetylase RimI-like enzyme